MIVKARVTILTDNSVKRPDLGAEHGFSALIQADGFRILFDTGAGGALMPNAHALGIDLSQLNAVVLSHGHFDHTGGLARIPASPDTPVFLHPAALDARFTPDRQGRPRAIGMPESSKSALQGRSVVCATKPAEIVPGVWCTGEIPRSHAGSKERNQFFLNSACTIPDPLVDDQALFFETGAGVVVMTGCGHSGISNVLDYVCSLSAEANLFALIGGFHLLKATADELQALGEDLAGHRIGMIAPCHCTGADAQAFLKARFGSGVLDVGAGSVIEFPAGG